MSARHIFSPDELWANVPYKDRVKEASYWVYAVALKMGAIFAPVDTLVVLQRAHDEMLAATGKTFSMLTAERYFSSGVPGCRGRLNSFGFDWQRKNCHVRIVLRPPEELTNGIQTESAESK